MILLGNEVFDKENLKARVYVYKILVFEMWKVEQELLFGWPVSVTKFSVFITHNSKMVGPIAKRLFGKFITLFLSLNFVIFEL